MAERRETNPMFSGPVLLAVTAVVGGLIWSSGPLRSSRPGDKPGQERASIGDQAVEARLWQDPFEAIPTNVFAQSPIGTNSSFSINAMARQIERRSKELSDRKDANTNITVLQVMLSGG